MNLVDLWKAKRTIGGLGYEELDRVLGGQNSNIRVKMSGQGLVVLSNNVVLRCAGDYYHNPTTDKQPRKTTSAAIRCHAIKESFGISGLQNFSCSECHRQCIAMYRNNQLERVRSRR